MPDVRTLIAYASSHRVDGLHDQSLAGNGHDSAICRDDEPGGTLDGRLLLVLLHRILRRRDRRGRICLLL